ncbi:alpha/beta hydrolase [Nocardia sp. CDC159]|uniref:Alpha/beta hydrolase n=1 Tax=Nocardia pulmonis TaxID=2951408 RepID=A0A9X2E5D4_9NOCA|nr:MULTISPECIES: alpha/beta hydrolase [Nocardia]MCM6771916.1 alpha/beta hydrolase [Nocardia pulmonis]MCM6785426.1 alpha/beta hydrolase [Nocardia sp. CDC159]
MGTKDSVLAALAAAAALTLSATIPAAADGLPGAIEIPCAADVLQQSVDWFVPDGPARGLIWLQHGFARTHANVAELAQTFADAGHLVFVPSLPFMNLSGCTLQSLGDNTAFLNNVAALLSGDRAGALRASLAAALGPDREIPAIPEQFVFVGHSAGAEAVEYVAYRMQASAPRVWAGLRGLVLLDPVRSFLGDNTDRALAALDPTGLPILAVSSPPSWCNTFGTGTDALQRHLHRPFVGVRLADGAHTDAEGNSSDPVGESLCGTPRPANVATLHRLVLGWIGDFFAGTTTPDYYPTTAGTIPAAPEVQILHGA